LTSCSAARRAFAALALKREGGVAVAFFGDGATNQGYFHECLNFARVFRLPAVYVCENNLYGEFTPYEQVTAGEIRARAETLDISSQTIDGNDVWGVQAAAREAVERARAGEGPCFIEALTYRYVGHSRSDPGRYRKPGELDEWRARDPLTRAREAIGDTSEADQAVEDQIAQVIENALAAPFPSPDPDAREFKDG
jgi:TPP-dependent pyruvate/acetoin dehydrogenase alpha subunit